VAIPTETYPAGLRLLAVSCLMWCAGCMHVASAAANQAEGPLPSLDTPPVAVLVEPGFRAYGGTPSVVPAQIPGILNRYGIPAKALSVADLRAVETLDPAAYPVLVLPYGNAFPAPALHILRAYHAAGGCLIMNGVPFTHRCERKDGVWKDLGHFNHFGHGPDGMGTGGFAGPLTGTLAVQHHGFQPNPLGLDSDLPLASEPVKRQWLDTASLPDEDEVIPLVGLVSGEDDTVHPISAIIKHRCAAFRGAIDVWIGQVAPAMELDDAFCARQLLVRGAVWCLREKGLVDDGAQRAVFAALDRAARPTPLPENLTYKPEPRSWGDTFLPKSNLPARRLLVVEGAGMSAEDRVAVACLQGLTSRTQPRIWLQFWGGPQFWLDWHVEKGYIDGYDRVEDWRDLFRQFRDSFRGAVVPDPALYRGNLLAANVAACEDLILATPELAEALGIPVKIDLRGRFATYADGLEWIWQTYRSRLNRHLCNYAHPDRLANGAFAYDVQWRGVMLWPCGPVDGTKPGADMLREKAVVARIMSELAPNSPVMGFPYGGHGVGLGEVSGVALASRYAKPLVCTDHLANLSVMSGVRVEQLRQSRPGPPPALQRDKIYIAMALSDGDNQNCWMHFMKRYIEHPRFGEFPLAFGMGPVMADLMPGVAQWYLEQGGPGTEFLADVSGVGYIQPQNYGTAFADRDAVLSGFLDWTRRYLARMDMRTLRTVRGSDDLLARYAAAMPDLHSLFADMGRYSGHEGIANLTYTLPDGMPVFRAVTSWRHGTGSVPKEIREQVGDVRPAFVNAFLHCWTYKNLDLIAALYDNRPADWVFVTPAHLATLYRQARDKGWIGGGREAAAP
jgi:hypothetical protein